MFIVRHKDTPLDGTAPALQYGPPNPSPFPSSFGIRGLTVGPGSQDTEALTSPSTRSSTDPFSNSSKNVRVWLPSPTFEVEVSSVGSGTLLVPGNGRCVRYARDSSSIGLDVIFLAQVNCFDDFIAAS